MNSKSFRFGAGFAVVLLVGALLGAMSADQVLRGSAPTGAGQIACTTSSTQGAWLSPSSCWDDLTLGATDASHAIGWSSYPATSTNMLRYQFGDQASGIQSGSGDRMQIWSYHGIEIDGARALLTPPTAASGGGIGDYALAVNSGGTLALVAIGQTVLSGNVQIGSSGTLISSISGVSKIHRVSATWNVTVGANSCTDQTFTDSQAATGAACIISPNLSSGSFPDWWTWQCYVVGTTVHDHLCNISTSSNTLNETYTHVIINP